MTEGKSCCATKKSCCGPNVGTTDRILRAAIGGALLTIVFTGPHTMWGLLGLPLLASALVGKCFMYSVLGMNTTSCCKSKTDGAPAEMAKSGGSCCGGGGHNHDHGQTPPAA